MDIKLEHNLYLLNSQNWPCPGSHYFHTKKFISAFKGYGFKVSELNSVIDFYKVKKNDIIYISDHGFNHDSIEFQELEILSKMKCNLILWHWHEYLELAESLFKGRYVLTGEHFYRKPNLFKHQERWNIQESITQYIPLTFAADISPLEIGTINSDKYFLAHFIGAGYKKNLNRRLRIKFRKIKIINTPPFVPELYRRQIFYSSKVALGWHSDDNLVNNVVVERVFEGLAFGNIVMSDSVIAQDITDGIVKYIKNYQEAVDYLKLINKDKNFYNLKIEQGLKWAKDKGTYTHVAKKFINFFYPQEIGNYKI